MYVYGFEEKLNYTTSAIRLALSQSNLQTKQDIHSRFSQNPSQAKNQKNSSNESKAIFQYLCMSKVYAEILRIGFPSCFRDFGP